MSTLSYSFDLQVVNPGGSGHKQQANLTVNSNNEIVSCQPACAKNFHQQLVLGWEKATVETDYCKLVMTNVVCEIN